MPAHAQTMPWEQLSPEQKVLAMRGFARALKQGGDRRQLEQEFYAQFGVWPDEVSLDKGM